MNRIVITVLTTVIVILSVVSLLLWKKYDTLTKPEKIRLEILSSKLTGAGKLILAEEKVYQEYTRTFTKDLPLSQKLEAKILFRWMTTFQYVINLQDRRFRLVRKGSSLMVSCPGIELNEPAIDISTYAPGIVLEKSIVFDEQRLINEEVRGFNAMAFESGKKLMKDPRVKKICLDQIRLVVLKFASELHIQADEVDIIFPDEA